MSPNVYTLLSLGKHPLSGRNRRASEDAQAFEMAAVLGKNTGIHAGQYSNAEQLRSFVGMNIAPVAILDIEIQSDPVHALAAYFKQIQFDLILAGSQAESGESSGMLPYILAKELSIPIVSQVCEANVITLDGEQVVKIVQALPRGARRALTIKLPCLLIIDSNAAPARQSAFAPAMRGSIEKISGYSQLDDMAVNFQFSSAQKKPKRIKKVTGKTAADRFKAATASQAKGGQIITPKTPEEGAQAILNLLKAEGL